jgi:hypothetical protein
MWEPTTCAASTAKPVLVDGTASEHYAATGGGVQIKMRWYANDGATPRSGEIAQA